MVTLVTLKKIMGDVLKGLDFVRASIDIVIVFYNTIEEHIAAIGQMETKDSRRTRKHATNSEELRCMGGQGLARNEREPPYVWSYPTSYQNTVTTKWRAGVQGSDGDDKVSDIPFLVDVSRERWGNIRSNGDRSHRMGTLPSYSSKISRPFTWLLALFYIDFTRRLSRQYKNGPCNLLICVEHMTSWPVARAMSAVTDKTISKCIDEVVHHFAL